MVHQEKFCCSFVKEINRMNQIKYILSACLLLLMIFMALFLYTTFPESGIVASAGNFNSDQIPDAAAPVSKGLQLFKQNCASCHALDKDLVGPALRGVGERGPWAADKENLKKWIKDPRPFVANDPYAKALKNRFGQTMPAQSQLSDADIEELVDYITNAN
jgi:mono/diheme cytochrome c family protein